LKLVRYVYVVAESGHEAYLIEVLHKYCEAEDDQLIIVQEMSEFIKIMPPFPEA
jgi:hypothetical protein